MPLSIIQTSYLIMNQVFLAATIMVITTLSVVGIVTSSIAIAQNMSGGTPEKAKLPAEQNMTGNATNTTITEGVSPNFTG
jgi:hypothetical protein